MDKKTIILCATGSISATCLPRLLALLLDDYKVITFLSKGAAMFTTEEDIKKSNTKSALENLEFIGPVELNVETMKKCNEISKTASLLTILPLSANSLGKLSSGIIDDPITYLCKVWDNKKPFIIAPAMNNKMYENPVTQTQLEYCSLKYKAKIIPPVRGYFTSGEFGIGALAGVKDTAAFIRKCINTNK